MPSGYHKVQIIFQEIPEIYDKIKIKNTQNSDNISIIYKPNRTLSNHSKNMAFLALQLLKKTCKKKLSRQIPKKFAHITIKKNIPVSSGLGGASSNAAAVLKGLNKFWDLKLQQKKLLALAAKLGKDVPFFIIGGTALGTNYGEKITTLPSIKNLKFKIFTKSATTSDKTGLAYAALNISLCGKNSVKTKQLIKILKNKNSKITRKHFKKKLTQLLHNDFETLKAYKNLPKNHHLSGSGPSTFTVC